MTADGAQGGVDELATAGDAMGGGPTGGNSTSSMLPARTRSDLPAGAPSTRAASRISLGTAVA